MAVGTRCAVALALLAGATALRLPAPATAAFTEGARQSLAALSCAALIAASAPQLALAAESPPLTPAACKLECFRECNSLAPGNKDYCTSQCDTYCDSLPVEKTGSGDVLRTDADTALKATAAVKLGGGKDCDAYKTDAAKAYCEKSAANAKADSRARSEGMNNGLFGDSGVTYSEGVEDLFATVFGAKQQSKDVNKADIGQFTSEIGQAAKAAIGIPGE